MKEMTVTTIQSADEMKKYAADFVHSLVRDYSADKKGATNKTRATIVALSGDLGAGKTTFSQGFAAALGVVDVVQSPTFVIMKIYEIPEISGIPASDGTFRKLIHIDAYRLDKSSELLDLGFETMVADPHNLILIEWPERVADVLPEHITLRFEHVSENERTVVRR